MKHRGGMKMKEKIRLMARKITRDRSGVIYNEWAQVGVISGPIFDGAE